MLTKILLAEPNPAFAMMLKQVLEESGQYDVSVVASAAAAFNAATQSEYGLAILETDLEDASLRDLVTAIRARRPALAIMVILPLGSQPADIAELDIQGMLSKPFYIPDLESLIEQALSEPVGGVLPPPRPAVRKIAEPEPGGLAGGKPPVAPPPDPVPSPHGASSPSSASPDQSAPPPAPAWVLEDVNRAAQYLTTLTLESSAAAALLMHGDQLIAYAGQFGQDEAEELARAVADSWARDSGHSVRGAQVKFIQLSSGVDYLVYSTLAAAEVVLSMAFQAETPIGMIRKQAKQATAALLSSPAPGGPQPGGLPRAQAPAAPPPAAQQAPRPTPLIEIDQPPADAPDQAESAMPPPPPDAFDADWAPALPSTPPRPAAELRRQPEAEPPQPAAVAPEPASAAAEPAAPEPGAVQRGPAPEASAPRATDLPPVPLPGLRRTPHCLYALSYSLLLIPRSSHVRLASDLKERLDEWIRGVAAARDWRIESLDIAPDHVEISLACTPADAADDVARILMETTSEKALSEFPRIAAELASAGGGIWSPGYCVLTSSRRLAPDEAAAVVEYYRREQGL